MATSLLDWYRRLRGNATSTDEIRRSVERERHTRKVAEQRGKYIGAQCAATVDMTNGYTEVVCLRSMHRTSVRTESVGPEALGWCMSELSNRVCSCGATQHRAEVVIDKQ